MLLLIITAIAILAQILLALTVLLKDSRALSNRFFVLLSVTLILWSAFHFAFEAFPDWAGNIHVVRLTMFLVVLQNILFVLFTYTLRGKTIKLNRWAKGYFLLSSLTLIVALTPLMFHHLALNKQGGYYPVAQPGMALFLVHAAISVTAGFKNLIKQLKSSRGSRREQIIYILLGSVVLWGIVPVTNMVVSITMQTTLLAAFSPLYVFLFTSLIAIAIVKHQLFNLKLVIARSLAYLIALLVLIVTYAAAGFMLTAVIFEGASDTVRYAIYFAGVIGLVVSFHPIRLYFDKLTDNIFFRHSFDPQKVLDEVGETVANEVKLASLANNSLRILSSALKPSYMAILILDEDKKIIRRFMNGNSGVSLPDDLVNNLIRYKPTVLMVEDIQDSHRSLYDDMQKIDASMAVRLHTSKVTLGYILIGFKQNGGSYTSRDTNMLSVASDEIAVAIQNAIRFEEIKKFNETLQRRIDEATAELRASNAKLKSLDRAKDEFVSMASHQLRTPLTSVKGYVSMVLDGDAGDLNDRQRKLLEEAYASSQRMVYLIGDFLNISRLNTGKFMLEPSMVCLADVVSQEVEQLKPTATARKITLQYDRPSNVPEMMLDETKIRQVVMNYIDNAIYYSRPDSTVKIELTKNAHDISLKVKDNGIGVPPEERPRLFTKFFRAANARQARPDGTGIGLFMAKKVVIAHGGTIIFETTDGKGSTFGFSLPLKGATPRPK